VSLYGFGKLGATQHHYFENRTKVEYGYRACWLLLPSLLLSAQPPTHSRMSLNAAHTLHRRGGSRPS
jgi:hypothetical protein